jgi:hypothetical protein
MIVLRICIGIGTQSNTHGIQFRCGIESIIGQPFLHQLFGVPPVTFFSFTLPVRTECSSVLRAFIRFESAPFQSFKNIFFGSRNITALIGVFYPENEITPMLPGK